jgi:hypothetical protein
MCNQSCPGTSYSSQIDAIEIEDDSLQFVFGDAFSDGAVLGGADKSTNTGGGAQDTNNWWLLGAPASSPGGGRCVKRFEVPVWSYGFWACPKSPPPNTAFGTREVVNILMFDLSAYEEANPPADRPFKGGSELPQQGGAEPSPWAVSGTMYHFGRSSRRLSLKYGMAQVQGPCCDIGWYFYPTGGSVYRKLVIHPMRMVTQGGLVFATSYAATASLQVVKCYRQGNMQRGSRQCMNVTQAATLDGLKSEQDQSIWFSRQEGSPSSLVTQMYLKMLNQDESSFTMIGTTRLPYRRQLGRNDIWFEIISPGGAQTLDAQVATMLPDAL